MVSVWTNYTAFMGRGVQVNDSKESRRGRKWTGRWVSAWGVKRKGAESKERMKSNLNSLWKTSSKLLFRDSKKVNHVKKHRSRVLQMPGDAVDVVTPSTVFFLSVSHGKKWKETLLGAEGLIFWALIQRIQRQKERDLETHFPNGKNS